MQQANMESPLSAISAVVSVQAPGAGGVSTLTARSSGWPLAQRIRIAGIHDPMLACTTSDIRPLRIDPCGVPGVAAADRAGLFRRPSRLTAPAAPHPRYVPVGEAEPVQVARGSNTRSTGPGTNGGRTRTSTQTDSSNGSASGGSAAPAARVARAGRAAGGSSPGGRARSRAGRRCAPGAAAESSRRTRSR